MRLLIMAVMASTSLAVSATLAPAPTFSQTVVTQPAAGRPAAGKLVKYMPMGSEKAVELIDAIPVYYNTKEGLARAKKEGPVFLDWDYATCYRGRIVGLTEKTVTIKPEGHIQCNAIRFNADKTVQDERVYLQDNTEPPRTFIFTEHLRYWSGLRLQGGPVPGGLSPYTGHKIGDLQMGDVIFITCRCLGGMDYCDVTKIERRPGGRVPPFTLPPLLEKLLSPDKPRWHEVLNAEQAREEKAVAAAQRVLLRFIR